MSNTRSIREAEYGDAPAISALIRKCLRQTLAAHYSQAHIDQQYEVWSEAHIRRLMQWPERCMLVATRNEIVGTACLFKDSVRKLFVDPNFEGKGIGRCLMGRIEQVAIGRGLAMLTVQSSVNAAGFYRKLGYRFVGEKEVQGEPFILLQKSL